MTTSGDQSQLVILTSGDQLLVNMNSHLLATVFIISHVNMTSDFTFSRQILFFRELTSHISNRLAIVTGHIIEGVVS